MMIIIIIAIIIIIIIIIIVVAAYCVSHISVTNRELDVIIIVVFVVIIIIVRSLLGSSVFNCVCDGCLCFFRVLDGRRRGLSMECDARFSQLRLLDGGQWRRVLLVDCGQVEAHHDCNSSWSPLFELGACDCIGSTSAFLRHLALAHPTA